MEFPVVITNDNTYTRISVGIPQGSEPIFRLPGFSGHRGHLHDRQCRCIMYNNSGIPVTLNTHLHLNVLLVAAVYFERIGFSDPLEIRWNSKQNKPIPKGFSGRSVS